MRVSSRRSLGSFAAQTCSFSIMTVVNFPHRAWATSFQALSLMRHPDDVSDFDEYRRHLPGQWCPMVTVIGSVPSTGDRIGDPSEPRRFTVETSVYESSKSAPVAFSVACFLESTKRWHRVKTPTAGALLSITAKIDGRTTDTNQLALRVLDLAYLRRPAPVPTAAPTPSSTPTSERSVRWEGRATPSTPSKRRRERQRCRAFLRESTPTSHRGSLSSIDCRRERKSVYQSPVSIDHGRR
ncbi:hypothetical protein CEP54_015451 [Fusarium duplospermum]|uniref:Uncharacterized protein n=1 Tax=Fusarium duplospermum TaxID=1325734 RepID=A0A428NP18_9HYPO|nr:hypothetical protein CEP54_015451 [Fusarium duplospermum]